MDKLCLDCKIGILIQLASDNEDVCYCPYCEEVKHDCIARETKEVE